MKARQEACSPTAYPDGSRRQHILLIVAIARSGVRQNTGGIHVLANLRRKAPTCKRVVSRCFSALARRSAAASDYPSPNGRKVTLSLNSCNSFGVRESALAMMGIMLTVSCEEAQVGFKRGRADERGFILDQARLAPHASIAPHLKRPHGSHVELRQPAIRPH